MSPYGLLVAACQALALGSWCGLVYYLTRMMRNLRPGIPVWSGALAWNPFVALQAHRFTDTGRRYRLRAAQAFGTWVLAVAGSLMVLLLSAIR